LESGLDFTSVFLAVLFVLDPKIFSGYIINVLLLGAGVGFFLKNIIKKLNQLSS